MTIGEKIRALRREHNLKQKDLAEKINVSATALVFVEKGKRQPSKEMVLRLARFFNKPADYFLFEEAPDNKNNTRAQKLLDMSSIVWDYYKEQHIDITKDEFIEVIRYLAENEIYEEAQVRLVLPFIRKIVNQKKEALLA